MINKRKLQSLIYQLFCMFVGLAVISPIIYCVDVYKRQVSLPGSQPLKNSPPMYL